MVADWSVECSAEDPVLVVPWSAGKDQAEGSGFVDLRKDPYDLDHIPEAEQHPPLMQALRALNAGRSPVFTAKCDAWVLDVAELQELQMHLDVAESEHGAAWTGFASYIDLVWRERSIFASFHQSEQLLHRLVRLVAPIDQPAAMLDCVLRPAMVDITGPQEGFAVTLYVKALGHDLSSAKGEWALGLEAVVSLLRSKDLTLA